MKIFYNVTGSERKSLVAALSQELNAPAKYLGVPTFAFEVGDYTIDKAGVMEGPGNLDLVTALYAWHGFEAANIEHAELDSVEPQVNAGDVEMPNAAAEDGCDECTNTLTIEMPLEGFTEEGMANLDKLIASKVSLIKKALGIDALPIERTDTTLCFPWFDLGTPGDEVDAYVRFISALCAVAKKQQRVTAKEYPVDNEKLAFRVFLIRLGFVGNEYKAARKILLRNLAGNSAFKVVHQTEEADDHE